MSKYTTEVRYICEHYAGLDGSGSFADVDVILADSWRKVFDFNWEIFDENYRAVLATKILRHFYTREICEETVGLWKLRLQNKLNEIMPYYNQLYKSELLTFNPLYDIDVTTEHDRRSTDITVDNATTNNATNTTANSETNSNEVNKYSDTPQGSLVNVESGEYLTNARIINGTDNVNTSGNSNSNTTFVDNINRNGTEEYVTRVVGKSGGNSYAKLIREFRENMLNIDRMILDDLGVLFFGLW